MRSWSRITVLHVFIKSLKRLNGKFTMQEYTNALKLHEVLSADKYLTEKS
jgi:hypothetical protein